MSNQFILWSMLVLPWLTLFFMKKEDIHRYIPAALFTIFLNTVIIDAGTNLGFWATRENIYPLGQQIPYVYGALPAFTIWILRFTYGRFWLYAAIEIVLGILFAYVIQPWLIGRGIFAWPSGSALIAFAPVIPHFILIYLYQMWQEDALVPAIKKLFSPKLQPAATKPIFEDEGNKDDR